MAFNQGDLITATELNNTNSASISYGSGDLSSDWQQYCNFLFYCNRPSGEIIGHGTCQAGWYTGSWIWINRWENGSWVQKDSGGNETWFANSYISMDITSFGEGSYRVEMMSSNYAHYRNIDWLVNAKVTNEQGHYLKGITPMSIAYFRNRDTSYYENQVYTSIVGTTISYNVLNSRSIYTI